MPRPHTTTSHPWHGVSPGEAAPDCCTCYIEIVPTDAVKYEVDKATGILKVDRVQKYSNVAPTLYGFIPQTYCKEKVAQRAMDVIQRTGIIGDGDPLDVCVLTEKPITHGDILVRATPIGGLRMIDSNEADDKIIAVLAGDSVFGELTELSQVPRALIDRLRHYFLTYKLSPDQPAPVKVEIAQVYGRDEAREVIKASFEDYKVHYGT
jgi:inorganic pyrophosphatase